MRWTDSEAVLQLVDMATDVAICASEARQCDSARVGQDAGDQAQLDVLVPGTRRCSVSL